MCGRGQHQFLQVQLGKYVQVALAETEFLAPTLMKVTFESSIETNSKDFHSREEKMS